MNGDFHCSFFFSMQKHLCHRLFLTVAACTAVDGDAMTADGIYDPYEAQNRHVHAFNRDMDKVFVRPISIVYTTVLPDEIEDSVNNFSRNLSSPSIVVNSILQGICVAPGSAQCALRPTLLWAFWVCLMQPPTLESPNMIPILVRHFMFGVSAKAHIWNCLCTVTPTKETRSAYWSIFSPTR